MIKWNFENGNSVCATGILPRFLDIMMQCASVPYVDSL